MNLHSPQKLKEMHKQTNGWNKKRDHGHGDNLAYDYKIDRKRPTYYIIATPSVSCYLNKLIMNR